jgi:hypothetical protein
VGVVENIKKALTPGNGAEDNDSPARPAEKERPAALTDEERERVIEEAREDLPALDKKVEENLSRLRDLSRS